MMRNRVFALAFIFGGLMAGSASAQDAAESSNLLNGVAIKGYDPVAYFTVGQAVEGDPAITLDHEGVTYQFSSTEHRELFRGNPAQYVPAYGGWCAWAASRNSLADIDPAAFVIHGDRLYLNFSGWLNTRFKLRLDQNIEQADQFWPELAEEAASR